MIPRAAKRLAKRLQIRSPAELEGGDEGVPFETLKPAFSSSDLAVMQTAALEATAEGEVLGSWIGGRAVGSAFYSRSFDENDPKVAKTTNLLPLIGLFSLLAKRVVLRSYLAVSSMKKIRINELARELEVKPGVITRFVA